MTQPVPGEETDDGEEFEEDLRSPRPRCPWSSSSCWSSRSSSSPAPSPTSISRTSPTSSATRTVVVALGLVVAQAPRPAALSSMGASPVPIRSFPCTCCSWRSPTSGWSCRGAGALRRQRPLLPAQWMPTGTAVASDRARQRRLVRGARRTAGRDPALHLVDARGRLRLVHVERFLPAAPVAGRGRARRAVVVVASPSPRWSPNGSAQIIPMPARLTRGLH